MEASNAPRSSNGPSNMYVHKLSCSRPAVASNNGSPWRSGFSGSRQTSRPSSTTRSGRDAGRASILGPSRGRGDPEPPSAIIEQPFDDDDVAPRAIELGVSKVGAHFTKTDSLAQAAARRVLHEHARDELPEAGLACHIDQSAHRGRAGAMTAVVAGDIDGEFRDASIAVARSVRGRGGERDHLAGGVLDDDDRMRAVEPRAHVGDRSWIGFERRDAIVDTLVVDVADYRRIGGCRRPDAHLRNATTAGAAGPDSGEW